MKVMDKEDMTQTDTDQKPDVKKILAELDEETEDEEQDLVDEHVHGKEVRRRVLRILVIFAEVLALLLVIAGLYIVSKIEKVQHINIEVEKINQSISETVAENSVSGTMKGYTNIALFGVDARKGELKKNTRTDTILIASINNETGEVRLVSVYRDTYLNLGNDTYNKANSAYAEGGPEQAMKMLNMNLDLNITDFITVGFRGLTDTIDALGGIDIEVTDAEVYYLNDYQKIMAKQLGMEYIPVEGEGLQHLNGLQATAYCRIRYTKGDDYKRAERQRLVINKIFEKASHATPDQLETIADDVFGEIYTSMSLSEMVGHILKIGVYHLGKQDGFPQADMRGSGIVGRKGSCVFPQDLTANVIWLHQFLFEDMNYLPSEALQQYSEKITADTGGVRSSSTELTEGSDPFVNSEPATDELTQVGSSAGEMPEADPNAAPAADPNAVATPIAPTADPNAAAQPATATPAAPAADPNAVAQPEAATPAAPAADPNAAATPATPAAPAADPNAAATPAPAADPNAAATPEATPAPAADPNAAAATPETTTP